MIPRKLDNYIIREFIKVFAASLGAFLLVCLVGDVAERLSKFIDARAPWGLIVLFYLNKIPYYLMLILPASSLIATLFTLGQLNRHNELVAMLSSGISLPRIFVPLFVVMIFISVASFHINERIVPSSNERASDIYDYQIRGRPRPRSDFRRNVDYQGEDGRRWTAATFNLHRALLDEVKLLQFSGPPESPRIEYRIDADSAVFLPGGGWKFTRGTLRHFQTGSIRRGGEWAVSFENLRLPRLSEKPGDFVIEFKEAQQMSFDELEAAIRQKRRNGINTARDEVELWLKTAMPAACFIIVLFGAPLAVLRRKIGPGTGIALGVMVYILFMSNFYLTRSMGYSGTLHPAAAAWASNAIFAAVGFLIFFKVRK